MTDLSGIEGHHAHSMCSRSWLGLSKHERPFFSLAFASSSSLKALGVLIQSPALCWLLDITVGERGPCSQAASSQDALSLLSLEGDPLRAGPARPWRPHRKHLRKKDLTSSQVPLAGDLSQPWVLNTKGLSEATHECRSHVPSSSADPQSLLTAYRIPGNAGFLFLSSRQPSGGKSAFEGRTQDPGTVGGRELTEIRNTWKNQNNTTAPDGNWSGAVTQPESSPQSE